MHGRAPPSHVPHPDWCAGHFKLIGSGKGLPVVAFALKDGRKDAKGNDIKYDEFDIMARLKEYHWQLPAYCLPKHAECACLMLPLVAPLDLTHHLSCLVEPIRSTCLL